MFTALLRYGAAFVLFVYGFAKINGSQFTILDSELDKPMGQVSGFWLTWYYFGYSHFYGNFLALVQIIGAAFLTFRRTAFLGACILAPVLANIVLIDIFYGVDLGATVVAILLLATTIALITPRRKELVELFWPIGVPNDTPAHGWAAWCLRIGMLATAFGFTYWVASVNNRSPTSIDGTWDVVRVQPEAMRDQVPAVFFFEFNRAGKTVFKTKDGIYRTHHFEIDGESNRIRIWDTWLTKGTQLFDGSAALAAPELRLQGSLRDVGDVNILLRRRPRE